MNKPYNVQNTNICNGIFHISFFKALLINEGETTRGEKGIGAKRPGANGNRGETTRYRFAHTPLSLIPQKSEPVLKMYIPL
jgi:hypothetical protein